VIASWCAVNLNLNLAVYCFKAVAFTVEKLKLVLFYIFSIHALTVMWLVYALQAKNFDGSVFYTTLQSAVIMLLLFFVCMQLCSDSVFSHYLKNTFAHAKSVSVLYLILSKIS